MKFIAVLTLRFFITRRQALCPFPSFLSFFFINFFDMFFTLLLVLFGYIMMPGSRNSLLVRAPDS